MNLGAGGQNSVHSTRDMHEVVIVFAHYMVYLRNLVVLSGGCWSALSYAKQVTLGKLLNISLHPMFLIARVANMYFFALL